METQGATNPGILILTTSLSKPFLRLDKYVTLLQELERHMEVGGVWGCWALPLDAARAAPLASRHASASWYLSTMWLKVLTISPRRCPTSPGHYLPFRLKVRNRWKSLRNVKEMH